VAEAGAQIDDDVGCGEVGELDQVEEMADGSGLVEDHVVVELGCGSGFAKLQDSRGEIVEVVKAKAGRRMFFEDSMDLNPTKEAAGVWALLDAAAKCVVGCEVCGFESTSEGVGAAIEVSVGWGVRCEAEIRVELVVESVEEVDPSSQLIRFEEGGVGFQLGDEVTQMCSDHGSRVSISTLSLMDRVFWRSVEGQ
jgi:hypothetical protein